MEKSITIAKNPMIEISTWAKVKALLVRKKLEKSNEVDSASDLVSFLLIKHAKGEIDYEDYTPEKRKATKIDISKDSLEAYNNLPTNTKSYIINGLLRAWLKEN